MSNPYEGDSTNPLVPGIKGTNTTGTGVFGSGSCGVHGVNGPGANNPPPVGPGLWGESEFGYGVYAACVANDAIHADSTKGNAVVGVAHAQGTAGVLGISDNGNGVSGISKTGNGVFGSGGGFAGFFDGNVRVTRNLTVDQDVVLSGGDCAEQFDVASSDEAEPGTVMVIGPDSALRQSREAYDKSVAGVVSGAGDYKPGIVLDQREPAQNRKSIALVGKVYCKVDATYSPVEVGDLLTTSPTTGHAMKAQDPLHAFGAVIGKALRPIKAGRGLIPILVALQ
jgi:hypothetical protein